MKFVKLHREGHEILVNMSIVSDVFPSNENDKSTLNFNGNVEEGLTVDESLDEIYEKVKGSSN